MYIGHDMTLLQIYKESDEISQYVDERYLSASKACWRIFWYLIHREFPNVIRLAIHLPNKQLVYFDEKQDLTKLNDKMIETKLTAWFKTNKTNIEARKILYHDFPKYYSWNKSAKTMDKKKKT